MSCIHPNRSSRLDAFVMRLCMSKDWSLSSIIHDLKYKEDETLKEMLELLEQLPQTLTALKFGQGLRKSLELRSFKHMPDDIPDDSQKDFGDHARRVKLRANDRGREKHMNVAYKRSEKREKILHQNQAGSNSTCKADSNKAASRKAVHRKKEKKVYYSMDDAHY
jgi:hypothetical protein